MKKAKILLTAITVFAIVGGALAFKAKGLTKFYTEGITPGICDVEIQAKTTSNGFVTLATTVPGTCTTLEITTIE